MAFFVTAHITRFYSELFEALGQPVLEMHSRKAQGFRTRAAEQFRKESQQIMFSSDVSARGVDYPDVTLVIQVFSPCPLGFSVHLAPEPCRMQFPPCGKWLLKGLHLEHKSNLSNLGRRHRGLIHLFSY
jgi:hypothetical protein